MEENKNITNYPAPRESQLTGTEYMHKILQKVTVQKCQH